MREIRRALELRPDDTNILYNAACVYGVLEEKAEALALLRRLKQAGILNVDWARRDPDLACLHQDPEFLALIGSRFLILGVLRHTPQALARYARVNPTPSQPVAASGAQAIGRSRDGP